MILGKCRVSIEESLVMILGIWLMIWMYIDNLHHRRPSRLYHISPWMRHASICPNNDRNHLRVVLMLLPLHLIHHEWMPCVEVLLHLPSSSVHKRGNVVMCVKRGVRRIVILVGFLKSMGRLHNVILGGRLKYVDFWWI